MQWDQVDWRGSVGGATKNVSSLFLQLPLPLRDLVRMQLKLRCQLSQRLVLADRRQGYARLELRAMRAPGAPR